MWAQEEIIPLKASSKQRWRNHPSCTEGLSAISRLRGLSSFLCGEPASSSYCCLGLGAWRGAVLIRKMRVPAGSHAQSTLTQHSPGMCATLTVHQCPDTHTRKARSICLRLPHQGSLRDPDPWCCAWGWQWPAGLPAQRYANKVCRKALAFQNQGHQDAAWFGCAFHVQFNQHASRQLWHPVQPRMSIWNILLCLLKSVVCEWGRVDVSIVLQQCR